MRKGILLLFIFSLFLHITNAQVNLVPNPSFENHIGCPTNGSQLDSCNDWYSATAFGNPDYFNACGGSTVGSFGVPLNWLGYQNARTGNAYVGILAYGAFQSSFPDESKEYLQVQLTDSLINNYIYCVKFYISFTRPYVQQYNAIAIDKIGIYISNDTIYLNNGGTFQHTPQIESSAGVYLSDTTNWIEVSGQYTAHGGEKYITIGNFHLPSDTLGMPWGTYNSGFYFGAYYFLDDVSVVKCDSTSAGLQALDKSKDNSLALSPNPTSSIFQLTTNNQQLKTITIYNVLGEMVYQSEIRNAKSEIDISNQPQGVYFIQIKDVNNTIINKKLVKE